MSRKRTGRERPESRVGDLSTGPVRRGTGRAPRLRVIEGGSSRYGPGGTKRTVESRPDTSRRVGKESLRSRRRRRSITVFLLLLCLGIAAYVLSTPLLRYLDSRRELREAEEELREEEAATRFLEERKERAMSDGFLEEEARKMGYVKPGEIPIIVPEGTENEEGAASSRPPTGEGAAEESFHPGVPP